MTQLYRGRIAPEFQAKALKALDEYRGEKAALEQRITENNIWYQARYKKPSSGRQETEASTAFIFNAIENKYAEAVDNYPGLNISERLPDDERTARLLSQILPVQLELSHFKRCYKTCWRRKLKHGTAVYGVFYNEDIGDIEIRSVDLLNVYCDMHVENVQESPFLFITSVCDNRELREDYPAFRELFQGDAQVKTYSGTHTAPDKTEIVDCYYKKRENGKSILHMMKFAGGTLLDATEDRPEFSGGLYAHGKYPVVFDVLYPQEDGPFGFGMVDILKNPQLYIDKLDSVICKNAVIAGKIRYMVKDNGGINEREILDYSNDIIHVAGSVDDSNIRQLQANALDEFVITHRQNKILELKEIIGNRDFQQGGTFGGVTAAAAITTLQQTGEKMSRAMVDDSYDCYKELVAMMIELIREFYTDEKIYRLTDEHGQKEFKVFSANMMFHGDNRPAEFDVEIIPKRENPMTREANNQMILSMWQNGLLLPQNVGTAMPVLEALQFDGKEKLLGQLVSGQ